MRLYSKLQVQTKEKESLEGISYVFRMSLRIYTNRGLNGTFFFLPCVGIGITIKKIFKRVHKNELVKYSIHRHCLLLKLKYTNRCMLRVPFGAGGRQNKTNFHRHHHHCHFIILKQKSQQKIVRLNVKKIVLFQQFCSEPNPLTQTFLLPFEKPWQNI